MSLTTDEQDKHGHSDCDCDIEIIKLKSALSEKSKEIAVLEASLKGAESAASKLRQEIERLQSKIKYPDRLTLFEYERLIEWIKNPDRKEPAFAFTASACRDSSRAIKDSGIFDDIGKLRQERDRYRTALEKIIISLKEEAHLIAKEALK